MAYLSGRDVMSIRGVLGVFFLFVGALTVVTDPLDDVDALSRHFVPGLERFRTQLIDAANDQAWLFADPAREVARAVLPLYDVGAHWASDVECPVAAARSGASLSRSPPPA
jgi:hypothetical protein